MFRVRDRRAGAPVLPEIDANQILPNLWQGSEPPRGSTLRLHGFRGLVLCAMEHQPPSSSFPGVEVLHAPNDDAPRPPTELERQIAKTAARTVASMVEAGHPVLVTCHAGLNRSGLVSALAVHLLTGLNGKSCVHIVQANRPGALRNSFFCQALSSLPRRARR